MRRRGPAILLLILLIGVLAVLAIFLLTRNNNQNQTTGDTGAAPTATPAAGTPGAGGTGVITPAGSGATATTPASATVQVVAVTRNLAAGTQLLPDDLDTVAKPRSEYDPNNDLTDPVAAVGRILKNPLNARQVLTRADLVDGNFSNYMQQLVRDKRLEPGKKAFAYATNDLSTAAGLIAEGDLVDVVATYVFERTGDNNLIGQPGGTQQRPVDLELTTKTVLQNIRVLRVIRFGPPLEPFRAGAIRSTPTTAAQGSLDNPVTPTVAGGVGPGTPTPLPTLPPYQESGAQFPTTQILVLAVTDQEAEVLKFTREVRVSLSTALRSSISGNEQLASLAGLDADRTILAQIPVVHFTLRSRPVDPANPQDPAITIDKTSGVTYRTLVRDYGLPIPEVVFATGLSR